MRMGRFLTGVFLMLSLGASGDALDKLSSELDWIERGFWVALRHGDGAEYRREMETRLISFETLARSIQNQVTLNRKLKKALVIAAPAVRMQSIFKNLSTSQSTIRRFRFSFEPTAMAKFQGEFSRYHKELAEADAGEESGKKRGKRASVPRATLKNVPPEIYEQWLADITARNIAKFYRDKSNGSSSETKMIGNAVNEYLGAVNELRRGIVKVRQAVEFEYK